ncbi:MAG: adenylosuccinate lyase [Candidatus Sericytochromatia bacterium]|nr:MAG: adenylosuccinate lyase [Candidatus Sericytochromatia bacterium]
MQVKNQLKSNLFAISPLDGRYYNQVKELKEYFSEYALIKKRIYVELIYLSEIVYLIKEKKIDFLEIYKKISYDDILRVKEIEKITNHDVKSVEYFIKEKLNEKKLNEFREFVHFGLTSEDINNISYALLIKDSLTLIENYINEIISELKKIVRENYNLPMLARTHGQPATPTTLGKEFAVFINRLNNELDILKNIEIEAKLNGATGNFNAFYFTLPEKDFLSFSKNLINSLGLKANILTTQIEPHDSYSRIFDSLSRINNILIDMCIDIWLYISMNYFTLIKKDNEVGSSTMPHKVNPIDFENAEGNLGLSNSILEFMKNKLTKSRLQRDLSDSTVLRNIGVAFGYSILSYKSIKKGLLKLNPNKDKILKDLNDNPEVITEAIQTLLRLASIENPYEIMKDLTRGNKLTLEEIYSYIDNLNIDEKLKEKIKSLTPFNYIGIADKLALEII